ncbi:MAG: tRNA (adenosine(37)-N6)-dimethylallyltransferase MiaA [Candidatus Falkowbacteria bacterium]
MKNIHPRRTSKLLVIIGSTATGKTKLAVKLAHVYDGEIVSADSRQVYKGMDIGTGKDLQEYTVGTGHCPVPMKINYHLIDVVSPKTEFNLAKYMKLANKAIKDIQARGKLPILVGGTGLYVQAIIDGYNLSGTKPDKALRSRLEKKSVKQLQIILKKLDSSFKEDVKNKRYLIRYIEIVKQTKKPLKQALTKQESEYDYLILGITFPREIINQRIDERLVQRIASENMIKEIKDLHFKTGVSWKRLESFGLEYKFVSQYLQGKLSLEKMIEKLAIAIHQFAKRQMSWFRRWEKQACPLVPLSGIGRAGKIKWIKNYSEARSLIGKWMK